MVWVSRFAGWWMKTHLRKLPTENAFEGRVHQSDMPDLGGANRKRCIFPVTSLSSLSHYEIQVCRRALSLEEANAICAHAQTASGGNGVHDRPSLFVPPPDTSPTLVRSGTTVATTTAACEAEAAVDHNATIAPLSVSATKVAADPAAGGTPGEEGVVEGGSPDPRARLASVGMGQYPAGAGNLNELLSALFKEADKEGKVSCRGVASREET